MEAHFMFKRLTTVLLLGGLLGLVPNAAGAAEATSATPAQVAPSDVAPGAGYDLFHHDRDDDHYRCMYRCDRHRGGYDRHRYHKPRYCWYRDRWGWYRARCHGYDGHRHHTY
jgi:hypothetical protein